MNKIKYLIITLLAKKELRSHLLIKIQTVQTTEDVKKFMSTEESKRKARGFFCFYLLNVYSLNVEFE